MDHLRSAGSGISTHFAAVFIPAALLSVFLSKLFPFKGAGRGTHSIRFRAGVEQVNTPNEEPKTTAPPPAGGWNILYSPGRF